VERAPEVDMTAVGAAYLAGLAVDFWSSLDELAELPRSYESFHPRIGASERRERARRWNRAVQSVVRVYR